MANELKPCPFCGSEAQLKTIGNDFILATHSLTVRSKLKCGTEIGCSRFGCTVKIKVYTLRMSIAWTQEQAVAAWNTRTDPTRQALVEALKANNLQMLQSNNDSEYTQEANQLAIAALKLAGEQ